MGVLKSDDFEISAYEFASLLPGSENVQDSDYEFASLDNASEFKNNLSEDSIRLERQLEAKSNFNILELVRKSRGLTRQEAEDFDRKVEAEVEAHLAKVREEAYNEGFERGFEDGKSKAYEEGKQATDEQVGRLVSEIERLQEDIVSIYDKSKKDAYSMVKNLTKWIILKEVDEKYYLARLLEKLIYEINIKSNLVIHVNEDAFGYMPEIIKIVERKIGKLTNTRVEVDLDMQENGIKLESENTIIDGSLDAQFETIDRLFTNVGIDG